MALKDNALSRLIIERSPTLKRLEQAQNRNDKQIILVKQRSRKNANRVKYLVGAAVLNRMKKDSAYSGDLLSVVDEETKRMKDRIFLNEYGGFNLSIDEDKNEAS